MIPKYDHWHFVEHRLTSSPQKTNPVLSLKNIDNEKMKTYKTGKEFHYIKLDKPVNVISVTNDGNIIVIEKESNQLIWCKEEDLKSC